MYLKIRGCVILFCLFSDPDGNPSTEVQESHGDPTVRLKNLDIIVTGLKIFYEVREFEFLFVLTHNYTCIIFLKMIYNY